MNIADKLDALAMTADDWQVYRLLVDADAYEKTVKVYKRNGFAKLPHCGLDIGTCRHRLCGHCTKKTDCRLKK